jgi:putative PIN family toxin of toxin-antitoxin system
MRVILDTSVIVSGLISARGAPAQVIAHWLGGGFTLLHTPAIYVEYTDVLNRAWIHERMQATPHRMEAFLDAIVVLGELVTGYVDVAGQIRDPFDEMFLAGAQLGQADYLATVDKDLLTLGHYEQTEIVTPALFLQQIETIR